MGHLDILLLLLKMDSGAQEGGIAEVQDFKGNERRGDHELHEKKLL